MMGPSGGVKIVDPSNIRMAPYTTQILGDQGIYVIKVEARGGDPVRDIGPANSSRMETISLNWKCSKRSTVLNARKPDKLAVLKRMIVDANLFLYNRCPQSICRLGLSCEEVSALNPRIIYGGLHGFAKDGPYLRRSSFDYLTQGAVGIPWLAHIADGRELSYFPIAIADRGLSLCAVGKINAALYNHGCTGNGQRIDIPMIKMLASLVPGDHLGGETHRPSLGPAGYSRMLNSHGKPYPTKDGILAL